MSPMKKEILNKSYLCHHWGKYHVKNTAFSLESAHQLLVSLQSKKGDYSVKAKLNAYQSMFKLIKKSGFGGRSHKISFLSIQRFFVFKSEPHLIFLGVEKKKRLSFIVILFREMNDVNEVCDLIEKMKKGLTRETDHVRETEIIACSQKEREPTVVTYYEREVNEKPPISLMCHQTQSEPMEEKIVYIQKEEVLFTTPIVRQNIEYHYDERHTDDMGATTIDALLVRTDRSDVNSKQWAEDMKYLEYNPIKGTATETEFGPIYMYTAHFTPADNNIFGSCESDNDSWSGRSTDSISSSDHQGVITKKHDGSTVLMAHKGSDAGLCL